MSNKRPKVAVLSSTRSNNTKVDGAQVGKHNLITGITNAMCGAEHMSSVLAVVPPGTPTKAHIHPTSETILFVLEGWAGTLIGEELEPIFHGPGDFVFVPDNTIHIGFNLSTKDRLVLTETRSTAHFNKDVELKPDLEARALAKISDLQKQFLAGTLPLPSDWQSVMGKPYSFAEQQA